MAGKSAGATVIELGITVGGAESSIATPGWCLRCGAVKTRRGPGRNTRKSSARNIASWSSFAERSLRSRWKTATACTSG